MNGIVLLVSPASISLVEDGQANLASVAHPQEGTTQRRGDPGATGTPSTAQPIGPGPSGAQPSITDSCMQSAPMLLAMVAIFYFLLIRPQQKQEKRRKEMMAQLKKGDLVVTTSGLHGEVASVDQNTITLRVDRELKLIFDRNAVQRLAVEPGIIKATPKEGGTA